MINAKSTSVLYEYLFQLNDEELIDLVSKGNQYAFTVLYQRYLHIITRICSRFVCDGIELDDLLQEAAYGFYASVKSYNKDLNCKFITYYKVCVANAVKSYIRCENKQCHIPINKLKSISDNGNKFDGCNQDAELEDLSLNPEQFLLMHERLESYNKYVTTRLSKKELNVLFKYLNGYTYNEISNKLGISVKAVDNCMQRIRRKLKSIVSD